MEKDTITNDEIINPQFTEALRELNQAAEALNAAWEKFKKVEKIYMQDD